MTSSHQQVFKTKFKKTDEKENVHVGMENDWSGSLFLLWMIVREVLSVNEREREREREIQRERERERERDGSDVTIVALKLAMNSHFPLPKIRNWRGAYTFPCQKFALFVSPFTLPVSPFTERSPLWSWNSRWVHTFHCQKFFALFFPLFQMARATRRVIENPRQLIKSCPVLFCSSHRKNESN